jgi:hypothetical protein
VSVTKTDADGAALDAKTNAIVIRASKPGTYTTTLSNGRTVRSTIAVVPPPIDLTKAAWQLEAEDWQPANPYATTFGPQAAETRKLPVTISLTELKPWPAIPDLQHASGLAKYTTTFDLPASWTPSTAATLTLGEVFDSFTLTVNGQPVPIDQLSAEAEIGPYLKPGRNTLSVRVATTLNNRLANLDADVAGRGLVQGYGLVGPVVLTPCATSTVWRDAERRMR